MSGGVWYETYKESEISIVGCDYGLFSICAYNVDNIETSGKQIATLIESEISGGIPAANIFLTGYS